MQTNQLRKLASTYIVSLEVLVTVEPQGSEEVSEPLVATKAAKEVHEVLVTIEPQGPQEVPEPQGDIK